MAFQNETTLSDLVIVTKAFYGTDGCTRFIAIAILPVEYLCVFENRISEVPKFYASFLHTSKKWNCKDLSIDANQFFVCNVHTESHTLFEVVSLKNS